MNMPGLFCMIAAAGLVQVAFIDQVRLFGAGPDLFMALTVIAAVGLEAPTALAVGIATGMFKDVFDTSPFGVNILCFPLVAYLVSRLNRSLSLDTPLVCSVVTAAAVLLSRTFAWTALSYVQSSVPKGAFLRIIFLEAFLTALVIPLFLSIMRLRGRSLR